MYGMANLIDAVVKSIKERKADLMRYEMAIPGAVAQFDRWRMDEVKQLDPKDKELAFRYLQTLMQFVKMDQAISGNFPPRFWRTPMGSLLAYGYKLTIGERFIDHTEAACLMWNHMKDGKPDRAYYSPDDKASLRQRHRDRMTISQKYLYPKRGLPLLTAYYDPDVPIIGHSARLDRAEVQKIMQYEKSLAEKIDDQLGI